MFYRKRTTYYYGIKTYIKNGFWKCIETKGTRKEALERIKQLKESNFKGKLKIVKLEGSSTYVNVFRKTNK